MTAYYNSMGRYTGERYEEMMYDQNAFASGLARGYWH